MSTSLNKKRAIRAYTQSNPGLSGNQIYQHFKGSKFGIRKQEFYKLYRTVKHRPDPTPEKRYRATPIKYRKKPVKVRKIVPIKPELLPDTYIEEILRDTETGIPYYMRYTSQAQRRALKNHILHRGGKGSRGLKGHQLESISVEPVDYKDPAFG